MWSNEGRSSELGGRGVCAAVAVDKDRNSQHAVKWAIDKLDLINNKIFLIHVKCAQSDSQNISTNGRLPTQSEARQLFLPYRSMCARKGIQAQEVILQDLDIAEALCEYATINSITTIVLGAPSSGALLRAFKGVDVPTTVGNTAPDCCEVYVISKTRAVKLKSSKEHASSESIRPATFLHRGSLKYAVSEISSADGHSQPGVFSSESNNSMNEVRREHHQQNFSRGQPSVEDLNESFFKELFNCRNNNSASQDSRSSEYVAYGSNGDKELAACMAPSHGRHPTINRIQAIKPDIKQSNHPVQTKESNNSSHSGYGSSNHLQAMNQLPNRSQTAELEAELMRLKQEIQQITERYNAACYDASPEGAKVNGIVQSKPEESSHPDEAEDVQETAVAVEREKKKVKAAVELAQKAQYIAELESDKCKLFETKFKQAAEEKQKAMDVLAISGIQYRRYTTEEIEAATNHYSDENKIGEGGFGNVYKATLDHTPVAIKALKPDMSQGRIQFQREVEVLSCMRHPHMVILLGACPENGCLVYEHMDSGSLEDRLFCKDGSRPIPWPTRFRIAKEIAMALNFLHCMRPEPLVHRDLKPANILLDRHYVSKISDVGLARLVPQSAVDSVTEYHMTAAAGTFCYIDPEYQQTGQLGTKSDIYSLGVMLLQIITARPPMGLTHKVETAIEKGRFSEILDPTVKDWPVEEALSFAKLALKCCELRKKDRPDLNTEILPEMARLSELGAKLQAQNKTEAIM